MTFNSTITLRRLQITTSDGSGPQPLAVSVVVIVINHIE
jgi:hypothetical protein